MFYLLRRVSGDPIGDQEKLWDMIVFNYLSGNTDGHIKNFSLLYGMDLKHIRLAPAYDLVSTAVYPESTRAMAFSIGGDVLLDDITPDSFRRAASEAGIHPAIAMDRFYDLADRFEPALQQACEELRREGYDPSDYLARVPFLYRK